MKKIVLLLLIIILQQPLVASADMGPKPKVTFELLSEGQLFKEEVKAVMLQCLSQPAYSNKETIPELQINDYDEQKKCYWQPATMAWGGDCEEGKCIFTYMPPKNFKLALFISLNNQVLISEESSWSRHETTFQVDINNEQINIKETTPFITSKELIRILIFILIYLFFKLIFWIVYLIAAKIKLIQLWNVFTASLISIVLFYPFTYLTKDFRIQFLIALPFFTVIETYSLHLLSRKVINWNIGNFLVISIPNLIIGVASYIVYIAILAIFRFSLF